MICVTIHQRLRGLREIPEKPPSQPTDQPAHPETVKRQHRYEPQHSEGGRVLLPEILLPRIAPLASNCSTGNRLSNFNQRVGSKSSNYDLYR